MQASRTGLAMFALTLGLHTLALAESRSVDPRLLESPMYSDRIHPLDIDGTSELAAAARTFVERRGGRWTFLVDDRTERLGMAHGSGVPLIPGRGNDLAPWPWNPDDLPVQIDEVDPLVREFLDDHANLVVPRRGELILNRMASLVRQRGRLVSVYYDWRVDGVPVEGATVFVRLNSGNVTQFGSKGIARIAAPTRPVLDAAASKAALLRWSGDAEAARSVGEPELLLQPEEVDDQLAFRLVWKHRYVVFGRMETWEGRVDAITGEVVGFHDANLYNRVVGGVYPRSVYYRNEIRVPLPFLEVSVDGHSGFTDTGGRFGYPGGRALAVLDGSRVMTRCFDCSLPEQAVVETGQGIGLLDFGLGGQDEIGNGRSTPAERNTFYHLTQARRLALKWLPGSDWLREQRILANVNLDQTCNAFFSDVEQSVNFFRAGDGCNNTGEIADVIHHEWGHALDFATQVVDVATSEGTADVLAMHLTHSPKIAPGFELSGASIRDLDPSTSVFGTLTAERVAQGACVLPLLGVSEHCIGQVFGQTAFDLSRALIERHGHHTGWRTSERLFFVSLPDAGTYLPDSALAIYPAYLQADDDDGDLSNGTPHAAEIHAAFDRHGIATDPLPTSPPCVPPEPPQVALSPACEAFELSWPPVDSAARYEVLRAELAEDSAFFSQALVSSRRGSFVDEEVAAGVDYWYQVLAISDDGCESAVEDPVHAYFPPRPILSVEQAQVVDSSRGNRSGYADPGEQIELGLRVRNLGDADSEPFRATARAISPGARVVTGSLEWSAIAAGESGENLAALQVEVAADEPCGGVVRFELTLEEDALGCLPSDASFFDLRLGEADGAGGFVCDPTPPCFEPPSFEGLGRIAPGASCGEIVLTWQPAATHCENAEVSYDVHRLTDEASIAGTATRVATGLTGTRFIDRLLEPGMEYRYLVQAVDSRSGADRNAVIRSIRSPLAPDLAAPIFGGVGRVETGEACGETVLQWEPALESCSLPVSYEIYRSTDPRFVPGPSTRIASTLSPGFVDAALEPGETYTYMVRARDAAGNESVGKLRGSAGSRTFDRVLVSETFERNDGGWRVIEPNDAWRGNWEWGDPEGTIVQPEDDATLEGAKCWITGLSRSVGGDHANNDVDFGATTLLSTRYELDGAVDPVLRYSRWFTNDRGQNAGDPRDAFRLEVSNDNGTTWYRLDWVGAGTPLEWVTVDRPFGRLVEATDFVRFRVTAADIGQNVLDVSWVEAGIDDVTILDRGQGCASCTSTVTPVGSVRLERDGDDVVIDWSDATAEAERYAIYKLEGRRYERSVRIGTTVGERFRHSGAGRSPESFAYRVSAIDECGKESDLH